MYLDILVGILMDKNKLSILNKDELIKILRYLGHIISKWIVIGYHDNRLQVRINPKVKISEVYELLKKHKQSMA